jgi:peptidoglycan/xylan/chitin deacetylase (PgdA/CDA1 family)
LRLLLVLLMLLPSVAIGDTAKEQVVILCYHEVEETTTTRYTVSRENFREQLDLITSSGHTVVPLEEAVAYLTGKVETIAPMPVVITVDDGWSCTRTEMFAEFEKRKMPYSVFVYPKAISHGAHSMTWDMVREVAAGIGAVESHALTHPFLTRTRNTSVTTEAYPEWLRNELVESKARIEKNVEKKVRFLAYPFGDFDEAVAASAEAAGYEAALTTNRGPNRVGDDPYRLKRYLFHGDTTVEDLARWLRGGPM